MRRRLLIAILISSILITLLSSCEVEDILDDPFMTDPSDLQTNGNYGTESTDSTDNLGDESGAENDSLVSSAGLSYLKNLDGKSYTVVGIGECTDKHIVVDTYEGMPVTAVSIYAFTHCTEIVEVTLGDSVKSVGHSAFHGCTSLKKVTMSKSVVNVGIDVFGECRNLESITLSGELELIEERAFYFCKSLKVIEYGGTGDMWERLEKGRNWDYMTDAYVVKCSDRTIEKVVATDEESNKNERISESEVESDAS